LRCQLPHHSISTSSRDCRLDRLLFCAEGAFQCVLRRGGPVYIAAASSLIASVVFVYFAAVFPQVSVCSRSVHALWQKTCFLVLISCLCLQILASNSRLVAAGHLVSGLFCLLNIIFNYVQCVITDPGSTEILDTSVSTRSQAFSYRPF